MHSFTAWARTRPTGNGNSIRYSCYQLTDTSLPTTVASLLNIAAQQKAMYGANNTSTSSASPSPCTCLTVGDACYTAGAARTISEGLDVLNMHLQDIFKTSSRAPSGRKVCVEKCYPCRIYHGSFRVRVRATRVRQDDSDFSLCPYWCQLASLLSGVHPVHMVVLDATPPPCAYYALNSVASDPARPCFPNIWGFHDELHLQR